MKPEELPPYAGLMEVDDAGTIRTVHQTKRIHREKLEVKSILQVSSSVNVRYWNYRLKEVWSVA